MLSRRLGSWMMHCRLWYVGFEKPPMEVMKGFAKGTTIFSLSTGLVASLVNVSLYATQPSLALSRQHTASFLVTSSNHDLIFSPKETHLKGFMVFSIIIMQTYKDEGIFYELLPNFQKHFLSSTQIQDGLSGLKFLQVQKIFLSYIQ